jgi:hypothetical protein
MDDFYIQLIILSASIYSKTQYITDDKLSRDIGNR